MKKAAKKLFCVACLSGLAYVAAKLYQKDEVQDKLFELLGEDKYLAVEGTIRLLCDLLQWPVHFVKALLP